MTRHKISALFQIPNKLIHWAHQNQ